MDPEFGVGTAPQKVSQTQTQLPNPAQTAELFDSSCRNAGAAAALIDCVQGRRAWRTTLLLAYQSLGVVYGDLSISPLYVYKSTFAEDITHSETNQEIFGALSFVFWTLTLVPLLKYATIVLRADDSGEGTCVCLAPPRPPTPPLLLLAHHHHLSDPAPRRRHVRALLPHLPPRQCQPPPQPPGRRRGALHLQAGAPARGRREVRPAQGVAGEAHEAAHRAARHGHDRHLHGHRRRRPHASHLR
jgi:hypothetical protein